MPKGKLKITDAEMPAFMSACELVDGVKIDEENSKKVGAINIIQFSVKTVGDAFDIARYMNQIPAQPEKKAAQKAE